MSRVSIREIGEKIKAFLTREPVFFSLCLLLVFAAGIGFGRLSVAIAPLPERPPIEIIQKTVTSTSTVIGSLNVAKDAEAASQAAASADALPAPVSGGYVASKKSTKYHLPWCSGAKRIAEENKIWFATKEEAERQGYTPAENCPGI
jgi:hypothetical protein